MEKRKIDPIKQELVDGLKKTDQRRIRKAYDQGLDAVPGYSLEDILDTFAVDTGWKYVAVFARDGRMFAFRYGPRQYDPGSLREVRRVAKTVYDYVPID